MPYQEKLFSLFYKKKNIYTYLSKWFTTSVIFTCFPHTLNVQDHSDGSDRKNKSFSMRFYKKNKQKFNEGFLFKSKYRFALFF